MLRTRSIAAAGLIVVLLCACGQPAPPHRESKRRRPIAEQQHKRPTAEAKGTASTAASHHPAGAPSSTSVVTARATMPVAGTYRYRVTTTSPAGTREHVQIDR